MKYVGWLKDRTPHSDLHGKSPYEMKHGKSPHLGGIHAFGTAVYVKDLNMTFMPNLAILWAMMLNLRVSTSIGQQSTLYQSKEMQCSMMTMYLMRQQLSLVTCMRVRRIKSARSHT